MPCCRYPNTSVQQIPALLILSLPAVINNILHNLVEHFLNQRCPDPDVFDGLRRQDGCFACGGSLSLEGLLPTGLMFPAEGAKAKAVRVRTRVTGSCAAKAARGGVGAHPVYLPCVRTPAVCATDQRCHWAVELQSGHPQGLSENHGSN